MKKLHIGDTANVPVCLRDIERKNGMQSDVICSYTSPMKYDTDFYIPIDGYDIKSIINILKTFKLGLKYDIIQIHHKLPLGADVLFFKIMQKKVILHYHGTDIRWKKPALFHRFAREIIVSTPDLLEFAPERAKWLPNPFESKCEAPEYKKHNPIKIIHAPTRRDVKGTQRVTDAIHELKRKGYNIDFKLMENETHDEVMRELKDSDIVIDWINEKYGIYGVFSLESMAMAKPVIATIKPNIFSCKKPMLIKDGQVKIFPFEAPIISCYNKNLADVLEEWINKSEEELKAKGLECKKFVDNYHTYTNYEGMK